VAFQELAADWRCGALLLARTSIETGGGWITSPAGACTPDAALTGRADAGFVSKYQKGAKAQFKGTGTINGEGNHGFMLTAIDGAQRGGGGAAG
jgi:hypothetical protein